jgi:katanin p60 ATPase-containing subunit A1
MDGLNNDNEEEIKVMVLAATNHPWRIDQAFRRRFEKRVYVSLPNENESRLALLNLYLKNVSISSDLNIESIAESLKGYSGADIANVCRSVEIIILYVIFF